MYWLAFFLLPTVVYAARPGVSSSRRFLAGALALAVPLAGVVLATLVRRTRGGALELEPELDTPRFRMAPADAARLAEQPPMIDRLLAGDPGERLNALVALSNAGDDNAVNVLRWAVEHGPPEVVLDAALTLEELELRCESRLTTALAALTAAPSPCASLALDVAHAAEAMVLNRLADAALAPRLVAVACDAYARALAWAPEHAVEIKRDWARLEACTGHRAVTLHTLAPAQPEAVRASGEIDLSRKQQSLPRRISQVFQVREVAAAALMS
jgi:hypothetical protein